MKKIELTKEMTLIVPMDIKKVIDGDKLEQCLSAVILQYKRQSQFREASIIETLKNSLLQLPDIYLYLED